MILKRTLSGLIVVLFLLSISAFSFASELEQIRGAIKQKHARWIAGETSVSSLPTELRKLRVGLKKPANTEAEGLVTSVPPAVGLPPSLDWRSYASNGTLPENYITPVRDQGNCGSCWAFATTGALESYALIKNYTPGIDENFAEQILLSCSGAGSCNGGYIDKASNFIRATGLPAESYYPYAATNGYCGNALSGWRSNAAENRTGGWFYVATTAPTVDAIKSALYSYGPLVTTMNVYTDFFSYKSGIYSFTSGRYEGGHAVLIVGYDDNAGGYFVVKNSWGTGWGEGGFFNIAYSQLNRTVQFGYWTIADNQQAPCTYSISPTSGSFTYSGGKGSFAVSAGANCSWGAVSNVSWITITSGSSGMGTGTVGYKVSQNTGRTARTGSITVAGQIYTVTQSHR